MSTGAYLLIKTAEDVGQDRHIESLEDLRSLPEVKYAEPVSGEYDCVARVEAPITLFYLVNKVMARGWIDRMQVLPVDQLAETAAESEDAQSARVVRRRQPTKGRRGALERPPWSVEQPHRRHGGPVGVEP